MTTIVTRIGKGSPLTHVEVDTNFTNLNTAKLETGAIALGTAGAPSISFTGDTNTGIFSPDADQLAISTNGVARLTTSTTAVSSSLAIDHPLGAVGTPSITFTGDLNTGFYSPAADTLAAVTAGQNRLHITSGGLVGLGTSTPNGRLVVTDPGVAVPTNGYGTGFMVTRADGLIGLAIGDLGSGTASYLQAKNFTNSDTKPIALNPSGGNVGIGTASPGAELHVNPGSGNVGNIYLDYGTGSTADGRLNIEVGSSAVLYETVKTGSLAQAWYVGGSEAMRIDTSRRLLVGTSTARALGPFGISHSIQIESTNGGNWPGLSITWNRSGDGFGPRLNFGRSHGATLGSNTVVQNNDELGGIYFYGADGTDLETAGAVITAEVDGTPGANDMPGRLVFSTTADGASNPTERMRIDSVGRVRPSITTLASYIYNNWNPSDVVGTSTNAPNAGTTSDSEFVTLANSSGTLTITFDIAGNYLIGTRAQTNHANVYTRDRLILAFGGTASALPPYASNSGDSVNDFDFAIGNSYLVSATAGQTCTVLPSYECVGAGVVANHTALCGITVLYCGG